METTKTNDGSVKMERIALDKIVFGKTDAFKELREFGQDYFVNSFVLNPKYHVEEFLSGSRYYICGKKGTGKSFFLKYLEYRFSEEKENLVFPIRFKSDIDTLDKENFEEIATTDSDNISNQRYETSSIRDQSSYVLVWKTFLINQIITRANLGEYKIFEDNEDYRQLVALLKCIYGESKTPAIVMPKIKRGSVELTAAFANNLSTSLKLELDFDSNKKRINYSKLSKKVYQLFSQLHFETSPVYVLIDELELSVRNKYQFEKDVALVRDLVIAIDDMNSLCKDNCQNIHIIASIRSEVLSNVRSAGYELTKPIEDCGVEINWFQRGGSYLDNPLLSIIENKIRASELLNGCPISNDIWETYFEKTINSDETRKYILDNSLYRPRDIIRMMLTIQDQIKTEDKFSQATFDKAQQEYSKKMWTELTDELRLSYSEDEVSAIFTVLNRITLPFTFDSLNARIANLSKIYPNVKKFFEKEPLINVLNKLYSLGVIGNSGKRMNFVFLERPEIDPLEPMVIHTPLRNYFSVKYIIKNDSGGAST